jgi:hypothetical protein
MSGTPSALGVIRYERDVIDRLGGDPDLLFIEFAVNDSGESTKSGAYEGLIRRGLQAGAAVILVFSVFQGNNTVMESQYKPIGTYYKLPMVSIGDATKDKYKLNGFNAWFYGDSLHPNNVGHTFMSDCIMTAIDKMDKDGLQEEALIPDPKKTADYENFHMISSDTEVDGELITASTRVVLTKRIHHSRRSSTSTMERPARHGSRIAGSIRLSHQLIHSRRQ